VKANICDLCSKPIPADEVAILWNVIGFLCRHTACVKALEAALNRKGVVPYKHPLNHRAQWSVSKWPKSGPR
jgi:hypothetical protein